LRNHHIDPNCYIDGGAHSYTNIHANANIVANQHADTNLHAPIVANQHTNTHSRHSNSDGVDRAEM